MCTPSVPEKVMFCDLKIVPEKNMLSFKHIVGPQIQHQITN